MLYSQCGSLYPTPVISNTVKFDEPVPCEHALKALHGAALHCMANAMP
jgi:hypothetical protein